MLTKVVKDDTIFSLHEKYETADFLLILVKNVTNEIPVVSF